MFLGTKTAPSVAWARHVESTLVAIEELSHFAGVPGPAELGKRKTISGMLGIADFTHGSTVRRFAD